MVNISSAMGRLAGRGYVAYGTAKGALAHYTRLAAADLSPRIRVNAIAVGSVATSALDIVMQTDELRQALEAGTPLKPHRRPRGHRRRRRLPGLRGRFVHHRQDPRGRRGHREPQPRHGPARRLTVGPHRPSPTARPHRPQGAPHDQDLPSRRLEHRQRRSSTPSPASTPGPTSSWSGCGCPTPTRWARTPASWPASDRTLGVAATDDVEALLALKPDVVVHTAMADNRLMEALADMQRILRAGVNVVSSGPVFLQYPYGVVDDSMIAPGASDAAVEGGASRSSSTGSTPGSPTTPCPWC